MMPKKGQAPAKGPGGSIIIWLTGLVFGVSAGLLLVYHFLLASRSIPDPAVSVAEASPAGNPMFSRASARQVESAHSAAAREALKSQPN